MQLGVDAHELVESDEYEGSSALRCYQAFVCPRYVCVSIIVSDNLETTNCHISEYVIDFKDKATTRFNYPTPKLLSISMLAWFLIHSKCIEYKIET